MKIYEILNCDGDQSTLRSIASAFTSNGRLKFPLDLEGMCKVAGPMQDQTTVPVSNLSMRAIRSGTSPSDKLYTVRPVMTGNSASNVSAIPVSLSRRPGESV